MRCSRNSRSPATAGRTTRELMAVVNLGMGRLEAMLKILDVEGAVRRDGTRWHRGGRAATGPTTPSATRRSPRCAAPSRRRWRRFGADGRCLMRALQEELDDPDAARLRSLLGVHGPRFGDAAGPGLVEQAAAPPALAADRARGTQDGAGCRGNDAKDSRATRGIEPGWALARFGDGGWWPAIERGLRAGEIDDEVVVALAEAAARGRGGASRG